jgi:hypothetical protein
LIITFFHIKIISVFFIRFSFGVSQRTSQKKAFFERNSEFSKIFFIIGVRVQRLVLFLVLCISLINPRIAFAGNYSDGIKAMKNGNHVEAVKLFRVAAENGDKYSQHCLGVILYQGRWVTENYTEGLKWLNLAAKQGFSQAILDLVIMKYHKKGTPNNYINEYN